MDIYRFIRFITVDPVNLSIKGKALSAISCFFAILWVALLTQEFCLNTAYPIIVASMGASAVILFIIPNSPLAQPWPLVGGQLLSAVIGVACAQAISDTGLAAACAVGGCVFAMLLLRCLHPPGAATAIAPIISGSSIASLGYGFALIPVGLNVAIMLVLAIAINRWVLGYEYPIVAHRSDNKKIKRNANVEPSQYTDISEQELKAALESMDTFMDVIPGDLSKLLNGVQKHRYILSRGNVACADIMVRNVTAVEYGTEVEEAWKIMHGEHLKAMPVIDRSRRVIGIISRNDFFKFIDLSAYQNFQERFRVFIRRTPDTSTDKPEAVGHIMTSKVAVLPESAHIAELIPLMSNRGYRQIPIVNSEDRLVGMVYQANLIAALYNEQLAASRI